MDLLGVPESMWPWSVSLFSVPRFTHGSDTQSLTGRLSHVGADPANSEVINVMGLLVDVDDTPKLIS